MESPASRRRGGLLCTVPGQRAFSHALSISLVLPADAHAVSSSTGLLLNWKAEFIPECVLAWLLLSDKDTQPSCL